MGVELCNEALLNKRIHSARPLARHEHGFLQTTACKGDERCVRRSTPLNLLNLTARLCASGSVAAAGPRRSDDVGCALGCYARE